MNGINQKGTVSSSMPRARFATIKRHKKTVVIVVLVMAIIAAVVGAVLYDQHQDALRRQREADAIAKQDQAEYDKASQLFETFRSKRNYDDAIATGQVYVRKAKVDQNAALMLGKIATVYEQKQDCKQALEVYRQAAARAKKEILAIYTGIGRCSYVLKDYKTSIEYNNKAIAIMKANGDKHLVMEIENLENANKVIEAKL